MYQRVYLAQHGLCFHCQQPMLMASAQKKKSGQYNLGWTREHVIPRSKGGKSNRNNIVLAHMKCNSARGNADPTPDMLKRAKEICADAIRISPKAAKENLMSLERRNHYLWPAAYKAPANRDTT